MGPFWVKKHNNTRSWEEVRTINNTNTTVENVLKLWQKHYCAFEFHGMHSNFSVDLIEGIIVKSVSEVSEEKKNYNCGVYACTWFLLLHQI